MSNNLEWSDHGAVFDAEGNGGSAFELGTWAVRAQMPDGTHKVRLLRRGLALDFPELREDDEFARQLLDVLIAQKQPVFIEHD